MFDFGLLRFESTEAHMTFQHNLFIYFLLRIDLSLVVEMKISKIRSSEFIKFNLRLHCQISLTTR
jgi:hypothetical protein